MSRKDFSKSVAAAPEADMAPAPVEAEKPAAAEEVPMAVMKAEEPAKVAPPYAPTAASAAPAKPKAKTAGHTFCRITGTNVIYRGQFVEVGTEGEFSDDVVLQMPDVFVSLE